MIKMAIVYLSNYDSWPMGGMLTYVRNIIPLLKNESGYEVDLWGCTVDGYETNPVKIGENEFYVNIYANSKTVKKRIPNFLKSFIFILKNRKGFKNYDVIYSHTSATTIAMRLLYPKKFIVHHQHGLSYKGVTGYRKILNLGYTIAQIVANMNLIVSSKKDTICHASKMKKYTKAKFYQIGSPINTKSKGILDNKTCEELIYIYTGRIDKWKNICLLVDAFQEYTKKTSKRVRLLIVGDGPEMQAVRDQINKYHCKNISLMGRKTNEEVKDLLLMADVFLFTSKGEGMPLSLLEAMAVGLPVIAFKVPGVESIVIHNYNGFLVEKQTTRDFCNGILKLEDTHMFFGENCMQFVKQYDSAVIAKRICYLIDRNIGVLV